MSSDVSSVSLGGYRLPNLRGLIVLYLPIVTLMSLVLLAALKAHVPVSTMTRDMAAIAKVHPFTGVVTNVGNLLWCATAAICLFACSLLRQRGNQSAARFLWWAGLMTIGLLVDDLFMFHEYLAPRYFLLNEKLVLASYAGVTLAYLLVHRRLILEASYRLLAAALVLFGCSMLVDMADGAGWWNLVEDGCKILGIASWFGYHAGRARHWLTQAPIPQTYASIDGAGR